MTGPLPLRIFVSSPGDLGEERALAARVIGRLSRRWEGRLRLEPYFWEREALPAPQSPQAGITSPADADIFLCLLGARLGTPLSAEFIRPDGSRYASGTQYELEIAEAAWRSRRRPEIYVYRKTTLPSVPLDDPQYRQRRDQLEALQSFLESWTRDGEGSLVRTVLEFAQPAELETRLEEHLGGVLARLAESEPLPAPVWLDGSPYRGLEVFGPEHVAIFFGRTRAVSALLAALRAQAAAGMPFVMVLGMSGSGKSSLVRAGLLPLLTEPGVVEGVKLWRQTLFLPSQTTGDLFDGLAAALLRQDALPELGSDPSLLARSLRESPDSAGLHATTALPTESRLALAVDQAEEIFTLASATPESRRGLVRALAALATTGRVWIVATLRSDFFARCEEIPELRSLLQGQGLFSIPPPTSAEIEQMIEGPAAAAGLRFEEPEDGGERLQDILRDAVSGRPERLPLLEFTLDLLFENRTPEGLLSRQAYDRLNGLEGAVATHAETTFGRLPRATQDSLSAVLWLLVTVRPEPGSPTTARRALAEDLPTPAARELADAFVKARLLTPGIDDQKRETRALAHESLLTQWPTAKDWLARNRRLLQVRARIEDDLALWLEGESEDLLIPPGRRLDEARDLVAKAPGPLSPDLVRYVRRSSDASQRNLWKSRAVALVVLALVGVLLFAYHLFREQRRAQAATALEKSAGTEDSRLALAWLAQAVRLDPDNPLARASLAATLVQRSWPLPALQIRERPLVLSPGLRHLATLDTEKRVRVWDLSTWKPGGTPFAIAVIDQEPQLSRDGHRFLWKGGVLSPSGQNIGILRVYNTRQGRLAGEWTPRNTSADWLSDALLSPRGDQVAVFVSDSASLWDLKTRQTTLLTPDARLANRWSFSPDGRWLMQYQEEGRIDRWDMDARPPRLTSMQPLQSQKRVEWKLSPGGRLGFATPDLLGWVDLPSGKVAAVERVFLSEYPRLRFDSDRMLAVNLRNTIVSRRVTPRLTPLPDIEPSQNDWGALAVSREGFWLLTSRHLWRALDGAAVGEGLPDEGESLSFLPGDPGIPRVLTFDKESVQVWAYAPPPVDRSLLLPEGDKGGLLLRGQNRLLTGRGSALALWDLRARKPLSTIPAAGISDSLALQKVSDDGQTVATCVGGVARVWDLKRGIPLPASFPCPDRPALYASSVELKRRRPVVTLSSDGRWIGAPNGVIREVATGRPVIQEDALWWIDFTPRNEVVMVRRGGATAADRDESVVVRTLPEGLLVHGPWPVEGARMAILSPTRKRIAVGGLLTIQLLEFPSGRVLFSAPLDSMLQDLAFDPQGRYLAVATQFTTHLRDAVTGQAMGAPFAAVSARSVHFSPDGTRLLVTGDGLSLLLDVASGQQIGDLLKTGEIADADFSPDGQSIRISSSEGVHIWDRPFLAPGEAKKLTRLAEAIAGQAIDDEGRAVPLRDPIGLLNELRREAVSAPFGEPTAASLTRWLLDWKTRPISPLSQMTSTEYVQHCIDQKTPEAWDAAERAFPGHPLLLRHPRPRVN